MTSATREPKEKVVRWEGSWLILALVLAGSMLGLSGAPRHRPDAPKPAADPPAWVGVYPPIPRQPSPGNSAGAGGEPGKYGARGLLDAPPVLRVLPGSLAGERTAAMEAVLRLQLYLALRDVYPGPTALAWSPAAQNEGDEAWRRRACAVQAREDGFLREAPWPQSLGVRRNAHRDRSVLLAVLGTGDDFRLEATVCSAAGGGKSQLFEGGRDGQQHVLRELASWVAMQAGVGRTLEFDDAWSRPVAPDGTTWAALADALLTTQQPLGHDPYAALFEPAQSIAEAAWLAARFAPDRARRRLNLERAAILRPGFTAALEDIAHDWLDAGRVDLAVATAERFLPRQGRERGSERILASRLRDEGREREARQMLAAAHTTGPKRLPAATSER